MPNGKQIAALRERIDALDEQIQVLISERANCAKQVAEVKLGAGEDTVFFRPEREAQVLRAIAGRNNGPLPDEEMLRLFREIMSACLALEKKLSIAFLGPVGTFTQAAALKHFGHSVHTVPLDAIDEVFREVESRAADYGIVPVENSTDGVVNHTLDMFQQSSLYICGEVELRIHHHLLSRDSGLEKIRRVYAHQQALAQCREWLDTKLPGVERIGVGSNAEAARLVRDEAGAAAIAGDAAADMYELRVIAGNIEDEPDNTTRFLVIGRQAVAPSGNDKTSLLVSVVNRPGALNHLLEPISRNGISMTRIESRPSRRGMWDYVFYIDLEGHREDRSVSAALGELEQVASFIKVLGSYPKAML